MKIILSEEQIKNLIINIQESYDDMNEDGESDPCWKGYHMVGKKMKDGKEVPNCVPSTK